jgi:hypothetical protein
VFDTKPQDVKSGMNGVAKFECVASGNPQPSVYWTKEGSQELMFPDNTYGRHHVTLEGVLEIKGVRKEDAGYYVCSAFSVAGSGSTRAFLEVSDRRWPRAIKGNTISANIYGSCVLSRALILSIYHTHKQRASVSRHDTKSNEYCENITKLKINVVLVIKSS